MSLSGIETGLLDCPAQTLSLIDRLISVPILCFKSGYDRGWKYVFRHPLRSPRDDGKFIPENAGS